MVWDRRLACPSSDVAWEEKFDSGCLGMDRRDARPTTQSPKTGETPVPLASLRAEKLRSSLHDQLGSRQTRRDQTKLSRAKNGIGFQTAGNSDFAADDANDLHLWAEDYDFVALLNGELIHSEQFVINESPD